MEEYFNQLANILRDKGNPEIALGQIAYMKDQFDFFGIKTPNRNVIVQDFFKTQGIFEKEDLKDFVRKCFDEPQREWHYVAIEMVEKALKKQSEDFIHFLEEMILTKSWWDSVDWIAKLVAEHFKRFPHLIKPITEGWVKSDNIWLQRMAITFQRYYKKNTDKALLFDYIERLSPSKEFFIQKGAGWALREYAKINPEAVLEFVNTHTLPALTRREALKHL